jgi:hypothetical protein
MAKWTMTVDDYAQARQIMMDAVALEHLVFKLKDGHQVTGWVFGSNVRTDVAEKLARGDGPVASKMYGEIRIRTDDGKVMLLEAVEVDSIGRLPNLH